MEQVECFDQRLVKAQNCSLSLADDYVKLANKGRNDDQAFNTLMMVSAYMSTLERYACHHERKKLHLHCHLTVSEVESIFEQVSILCGGCSCSYND